MEPEAVDHPFALTPIIMLHRYLKDNKELKAKIHWVGTRQDDDGNNGVSL